MFESDVFTLRIKRFKEDRPMKKIEKTEREREKKAALRFFFDFPKEE